MGMCYMPLGDQSNHGSSAACNTSLRFRSHVLTPLRQPPERDPGGAHIGLRGHEYTGTILKWGGGQQYAYMAYIHFTELIIRE